MVKVDRKGQKVENKTVEVDHKAWKVENKSFYVSQI
jgi:hypothetical protein